MSDIMPPMEISIRCSAKNTDAAAIASRILGLSAFSHNTLTISAQPSHKFIPGLVRLGIHLLRVNPNSLRFCNTIDIIGIYPLLRYELLLSLRLQS